MSSIYLGEPIGFDGATPPLGRSSVVFATDANHTASLADYSAKLMVVTATSPLTAPRALVVPLVSGAEFWVFNNTSGGQAINVGGATGTSVSVPNGFSVLCCCFDGANYSSGSGGGGGSSLPIVFNNVTVPLAAPSPQTFVMWADPNTGQLRMQDPSGAIVTLGALSIPASTFGFTILPS